jgi:hypothetical protein
MAGSGSYGKLLAIGLLLALVAVALVVVDRQTDRFNSVKEWAAHFMGNLR